MLEQTLEREPPLEQEQQAIYPGCWTSWFDTDNPTATGDWETLFAIRQRFKICEKPLQIEVQTTAGGSVASTGDVISVSDTTTGFVCENKKQNKTRMCSDYRVRFMCPVEFCHPKGCWTDWFNRDHPSGTGDWETLEHLHNEHPGKICENPLFLEAQTTTGGSVASTGDVISINSPSIGFVCINDVQTSGTCENYKVRFYCPEEFCVPKGCWTDWFDRDNPSGTGDWETLEHLHNEHPGKICENPLFLEAQTTTGGSVASTGDVISINSPSSGFVCINDVQTSGTCEDYKVRFYCPEEFCVPKGCWTDWFDRDNPSGTGDWETLEHLHNEHPGKICENPLFLEAQTTTGGSVASTGDVISINSPSSGFVCINDVQTSGTCEDYQVRFYCPEEFCVPKGCWTDWFDRDNPSGTGDWETLEHLYIEYPGKICETPLQIEVQTTSGNSVASTGDVIAVSDTSTGFGCKNSDQSTPFCADYKVRFFCPEEFCQPKGCWTKWFDRDNPGGTGDWELLSNLIDENPGKVCESPLQIEARTTSGNSVTSTGDVIAVFDSSNGFVCKISDQSGGYCDDYEVRFFCPEDFCKNKGCWTDWFDRDNPSGTGDWETLEHLYIEYPGKICETPLQIEVQTTSGNSVASTGDVIAVADTNNGFACRNMDQTGSMCHDYKVRFRCPLKFCIPKEIF
ncbi:mucin-5AC-like [Eucyclogobius newberryi]|uniref:mucin-5AC-like n=1 Tax=Eucyclogobius newberryi TaxID=166745 RepID=UPI003B59C5A4